MGWLQRLFGLEKPEDAQVNPVVIENAEEEESLPIERIGLSGEYDESGLAKRVALAFDEDERFNDLDSIYVAQLGKMIVLRGSVPSQDILDELVDVAANVTGTSDVDTNEVVVG